jgi:hypothetical protein
VVVPLHIGWELTAGLKRSADNEFMRVWRHLAAAGAL